MLRSLALLLTALSLAALSLSAQYVSHVERPDNLADSVVEVRLPTGHGSGVHIGGGYVLTAAHVASGFTVVTVVGSDGVEHAADVVRIDTAYDLALLHIADGLAGIGESHLTCRLPIVGEAITAIGYPFDMGRIRTWGRVAGVAYKFADRNIVFIADLSGAQGMSGGPVFDSIGRVLGFVVAGYGRIGPIMIIVPSAAACELSRS